MNLIKKITTEDTYFIRKEVLRKGIDKPYKFDGDFDENTFHLGAFNKGELVGVATFMKRKNDLIKDDQYQLRGIATLEDVRGLGYGNMLLAESFEVLKSKNVNTLWCNAREVALGFYKRNGFKVIGEPFDIALIGTHYVLYKEL